MSRFATIAEAVKDRLNDAPDGTFNEEFTAQRKYVPAVKLTDLEQDQLRVTVVAASRDQSLLDRTNNVDEIEIHVGVQRRISEDCQPDTEAGATELDGYATLAEQIADYLSVRGELASTGAKWLRTTNNPIYDTDQLMTERTFMSLISVTYKI